MNLNDFLKTLDSKTLQLIMTQGPAIVRNLPQEQRDALQKKISTMSDEEKKALLEKLKAAPAPETLLKSLLKK